MTLKREPHQGRNRSQECEDAWWYEYKNSIRVYCWKKGMNPVSFQIDRKAIESWIKRARKEKRRAR